MNSEWFEKRFYENFEKVKGKYDPTLHTIDQYTQSLIDCILLDPRYCKLLDSLKSELIQKQKKIFESITKFQSTAIRKVENTKLNISLEDYHNFDKHIDYIFTNIEWLTKSFNDHDESIFKEFNVNELNKHYSKHYNGIDHNSFREQLELQKEQNDIKYAIQDFNNTYNQFFRKYFHSDRKEMHFLANAAKGKTHTSCDIAYRKISEKKPAIFITGEKFTNESNLNEAFKRILDINSLYTIDEIIDILDTYGTILKTRIPIIIDGLNETTYNRLFSDIWVNHLSSFINRISHKKNLVLITTCRTSYSERIWNDTTGSQFHTLDGFEDIATINDAVHKYFSKYKIKADTFFASLEKFSDPIFLKIFCEIKNPYYLKSSEVSVNLEEESTYDIFNEYLSQINQRVTKEHPLLRSGENFIFSNIKKLSIYLWENQLREIPLDEFYNIIDGTNAFEKDKSKAEILINEGLVFNRDIRVEQEFVSFTYDILAGYMISKTLIENHSSTSYFVSNGFISKIKPHPYLEDVATSLCLLLPQFKKNAMYEIINIENYLIPKILQIPVIHSKPIKNKISYNLPFYQWLYHISIISIFKLPSLYIKNNDKQFINRIFNLNDKNKVLLFEQLIKLTSILSHPFNGNYLYDLLNSLPMNHRDITWTEYIRRNASNLEKYIQKFEEQCNYVGVETDNNKLHLISKIILWLLTSTNLNLRDKSTKALYFYGRRFPENFASLVYESLSINDPYVWERTLAALYGVVMAEHTSIVSDDFKNVILPKIARTIYDLIFSKNAHFPTSHILARDYAKRIVDISLFYHPTSLDLSEIKNITPPFEYGISKLLDEFDYEEEYGYSGPIRMDFSNYTIGRIVKEGGSYSNPPEKQEVRRQIYWRIFNLGWDEEYFEEAESNLSNDNYYMSRTERPKVERYGKKYSWIAYYEVAGVRNDLELIDRTYDDFRISDADLDPSFPVPVESNIFFKKDILGDRSISLLDWFKNGGLPSIREYLSVSDLYDNAGQWICLDAFIHQVDVSSNRKSFVFIRSFIVKEEEHVEILELLSKKNLGGRTLPEKKENHYTFAGELLYFPSATHENYTNLEFEISKRKIKIKKGEEDYLPSIIYHIKNGRRTIKNKKQPEEIEKEFSEVKHFRVLMPVMEYNWEMHHSPVNKAGHTTVIAKELANSMKLNSQPQTFDLVDINNKKSSININYNDIKDNSHHFIYLRKDLLDEYLKSTKQKLVFAIWGERELSFTIDQDRTAFYQANPGLGYQVFSEIIDYKN